MALRPKVYKIARDANDHLTEYAHAVGRSKSEVLRDIVVDYGSEPAIPAPPGNKQYAGVAAFAAPQEHDAAIERARLEHTSLVAEIESRIRALKLP